MSTQFSILMLCQLKIRRFQNKAHQAQNVGWVGRQRNPTLSMVLLGFVPQPSLQATSYYKLQASNRAEYICQKPDFCPWCKILRIVKKRENTVSGHGRLTKD
jgi:hypothetical protein